MMMSAPTLSADEYSQEFSHDRHADQSYQAIVDVLEQVDCGKAEQAQSAISSIAILAGQIEERYQHPVYEALLLKYPLCATWIESAFWPAKSSKSAKWPWIVGGVAVVGAITAAVIVLKR